jgi:hypothetical protein
MCKNSVFNEFGIVDKVTTSSRTSHRETLRSNKIGWCKVYANERDQVTQPNDTLDSETIYPITWSRNKHLETGKRKIKKCCLAHSAWSWWCRFVLNSSRNAWPDHCFFREGSHFLPHNHYVASLKHVYTCPLPNGWQASSIQSY